MNKLKKRRKHEDQKSDIVELKRSIDLFSAITIIVGTIIGSGIFISPKGVLLYSKSVGLSLVIWTLSGLFVLLGGLAYAELGTLIPDSGGEFIHMLEAFAPKRRYQKSWWRSVFAFSYTWQTTLLQRPAGIAVQCLVCAEYLARLGAGCANVLAVKSPQLAIKLIACCIIMVICIINVNSVKITLRMQNIFTTAKIVALLLVITGGIYQLSQGHFEQLQNAFQDSTTEFGDVVKAFYSGLYAYQGWEYVTLITKEMVNPRRDLPFALFTSIFLVIFVYICANVSYLSGLTVEELLASNTVAVDFGIKVAGSAGAFLMIFSVAVSAYGCANGSIITLSRLCHVSAREGHLMKLLSFVHIHNMTPAAATILTATISLMMVWSTDVLNLIHVIGFLKATYFGLVMIALLVMRRTRRDQYRAVKAPVIVPILILMFSLFLFLTPLIDKPSHLYFYAILFQVFGVVVYTIFVHYEWSLPGTGKITKFVQILVQVVPAENNYQLINGNGCTKDVS